MDSGNSGSISSSGDEEYDSRPHHTILPSTFLNQTPFNPQQQSSLLSSSHQHHSLFDLSSTYLHPFSQPQPNSSNPNSFLNLDTGTQRSEPNCTGGVGGGASSSSASALNHCLLAPSPSHQGLGGQCVTDPSLQLRPIHDDNNARASLSSSTNVVRNPKKRTRASRRAPTTVLTTDTSNFRAMVQEFTGIPAPPFSGSSYSRRLDLLTGSSSLRSSVSHHLDTITSPFYPLRPSPQKLQPHHQHHQNPLLLSSSPPSPSTLLHNNNMVDAIASTTNTANNSSSNHSSNNNNNNSINYQLHPPPDLGLPYNHHTQNIMLSMQNHPILTFHPPPPPLHPFGNHGGGFNAKSQSGLSIPSLEDLQGVNQGQVNNNNNAHLVGSGSGGSGVSVVPSVHQHVTNSEGMALRGSSDYGGKVGSSGKMNFSGSGSSNLNSTIEKRNLENNNNNNRGEGAVDSWICSSD